MARKLRGRLGSWAAEGIWQQIVVSLVVYLLAPAAGWAGVAKMLSTLGAPLVAAVWGGLAFAVVILLASLAFRRLSAIEARIAAGVSPATDSKEPRSEPEASSTASPLNGGNALRWWPFILAAVLSVIVAVPFLAGWDSPESSLSDVRTARGDLSTVAPQYDAAAYADLPRWFLAKSSGQDPRQLYQLGESVAAVKDPSFDRSTDTITFGEVSPPLTSKIDVEMLFDYQGLDLSCNGADGGALPWVQTPQTGSLSLIRIRPFWSAYGVRCRIISRR